MNGCQCILKSGKRAGQACRITPKPGSKYCGRHQQCEKTKVAEDPANLVFTAAEYFSLDEQKQMILITLDNPGATATKIMSKLKGKIRLSEKNKAYARDYIISVLGDHDLRVNPLPPKVRNSVKQAILDSDLEKTSVSSLLKHLQKVLGTEYVKKRRYALIQLAFSYSLAKLRAHRDLNCVKCLGHRARLS
jgi:hypothetical protein